MTANRFTHGGQGIDKAQTLADCQTACSQQSTCVAIDFAPGTPIKCFWHTATSIRNPPQPATGVSQYRIERCGVTTGKLLCHFSTLNHVVNNQHTVLSLNNGLFVVFHLFSIVYLYMVS